jgi:hypothetical protein
MWSIPQGTPGRACNCLILQLDPTAPLAVKPTRQCPLRTQPDFVVLVVVVVVGGGGFKRRPEAWL